MTSGLEAECVVVTTDSHWEQCGLTVTVGDDAMQSRVGEVASWEVGTLLDDLNDDYKFIHTC